MATEVKVPELGEGIEGAQVLTILVSAGDTIEADQPIIELETDKATAEVPSDSAGTVKEIRVKEGEDISVGQVILVLDAAAGAPEATPDEEPAAERPKALEEAPVPEPALAEPETEPVVEETVETPLPAPPPPPKQAPALEVVPPRSNVVPMPARPEGEVVPAAPSVRRLARELGIDIAAVGGSGPGGRISEDDVKSHARGLIARGGGEIAPGAAPAAPGVTLPQLPDFTQWGDVEREPMSRIKKVTAASMTTSWSVIPHVTQFDKADITDLNTWRKQYGPRAEAAGAKLTVTAIIIKTAAAALKVFPRFNSSLDMRTSELVLKKYVHVGVAVDTEFGLLVPVIKDADSKNIISIAAELGELSAKARDRKASIEELSGANFNISNLGGLGTTYFSPIVNWPQVAVLGVGRAEMTPVWKDGAFTPRLVLPLAVSYDHRVVDGADAARFLRWIAEALEQPLLLALEG